MLPLRDDHPLKSLFSGLVEHAFYSELGICDPALVDYISDLLVEFVHIDDIGMVRDAAGRPIGEIAALIDRLEVDHQLPSSARDRLVHRRIGDYTLFWSGVFPEGFRSHVGATWRDRVTDYISFGKRSYAIASELTVAGDRPPAVLLRHLSEEFESFVHGLGIVRRGLGDQEVGGHDDPRLIY